MPKKVEKRENWQGEDTEKRGRDELFFNFCREVRRGLRSHSTLMGVRLKRKCRKEESKYNVKRMEATQSTSDEKKIYYSRT